MPINNTGNDRSGQQYEVQSGTNSAGVPGDFHIYDGKTVFVAKPERAGGSADPGQSGSPGPTAMLPPDVMQNTPIAAAPPPTPDASAPVAPAPVAASPSDVPGAAYKVVQGYSSAGDAGDWHIYPDDRKVFVAKPDRPKFAGDNGGKPIFLDPTAGLGESTANPVPGAGTVVSPSAPSQAGPTNTGGVAPAPSHQGRQGAGVSTPQHGQTGAAGVAPSPASSPSSAPSSGSAHTVASGDSMYAIAQAHGMSLSQLEALNPQIKNPNLIHPGEKINLGGSNSGGGSANSNGTGSSGSTTAFHDSGPIAHRQPAHTLGNPGGDTPAVSHPHDSGVGPKGNAGAQPDHRPAAVGTPHDSGVGPKANAGPHPDHRPTGGTRHDSGPGPAANAGPHPDHRPTGGTPHDSGPKVGGHHSAPKVWRPDPRPTGGTPHDSGPNPHRQPAHTLGNPGGDQPAQSHPHDSGPNPHRQPAHHALSLIHI